MRLLLPEAVYGVAQGSFDGLKADGQAPDHYHHQGGEYKNPGRDGQPIGKVLQPVVNGKIGHWPRDERRDHDQLYKLTGKEGHQGGGTSTQHLADAYFLFANGRGVGDQAYEPQTGDADGQSGKYQKYPPGGRL